MHMSEGTFSHVLVPKFLRKYKKKIQHFSLPTVCLFDLGLTSLSTFFSHIATVSGCGRELNAHF